MAVEATLPTIGTVIVTAIVDSINPCAIGVLILMISTMLASHAGTRKIMKFGLMYTAAVYVTYFSAGIGLLAFISSVPLVIAEYITIAVSLLVVAGGIIEIKDFLWYGRGFSLAIPPEMAKKIHGYVQRVDMRMAIFLGVFVTAVELPCTGGPYLAILTILSQNFSWQVVGLLALYNLIFITPLVIILLMVYSGKKITGIKKWKHKARGWMRLLAGITLILLGWILMLIANYTINLA